jgi:hypothetical protein
MVTEMMLLVVRFNGWARVCGFVVVGRRRRVCSVPHWQLRRDARGQQLLRRLPQGGSLTTRWCTTSAPSLGCDLLIPTGVPGRSIHVTTADLPDASFFYFGGQLTSMPTSTLISGLGAQILAVKFPAC